MQQRNILLRPNHLSMVCTAAMLILRSLGVCNLHFVIVTLLDLVIARVSVLVP